MKIEIDNEIARKCGLDENEALELLVIAIYKFKGIHGAMAGRVLGISEMEFHALLSDKGQAINYGVDDLLDDIKTIEAYDMKSNQ